MALSKRLKDLKKKAGTLVPDPLEDLVSEAKDYLSNPLGVAKDVGRLSYEAPVFPSGRSLKQFRADYDRVNREISDPLREVVTIAGEEDFDPIATAKRSYQTQRGPGLGASFRARPNTLGKRVIENVIDPLNLIPVGTTLFGAKAAGVPITRALIRSAIREMAAPAAGQIGGYYAGKAVGGEKGAQIGEFAGLLGGSFGPNFVRGADTTTAAARAGRRSNDRVPGMGMMDTSSLRGASMQPWEMTREAFTESNPVRRGDMADYARAYLEQYKRGDPGISEGLRRPDGSGELVFRDDKGVPRGVIAFGRDAVTDIAVAPQARRQGIATQLLDAAAERGLTEVRGPYTPEGAAVAHRWYVRRAVDAGEPVPDDVLRQYPDLMQRRKKPPGALGLMPAAPTDRFYHGTGSAFDRPDAARFDPNGLFGPGYYLTSDPRVASDYALQRAPLDQGFIDRYQQLKDEHAKANAVLARAVRSYEESGRIPGVADDNADAHLTQLRRDRDLLWERLNAASDDRLNHLFGQQVRPVDVPRDLRLFDVERLVNRDDVENLAFTLGDKPEKLGLYPGYDGAKIYRHLVQNLSTAQANKVLYDAGYDGIRYDGGKRIPLMDGDGNPITHQAIVIFPESLDKVTNALSGTAGGLLPTPQPAGRSTREILGFDRAGLKADLTAGAIGAGANVGREVVFDDERDPKELAKAAGFGALAGASGAHIARLQRDLLPVSRITGESVPEARIRAEIGETVPPPPRQPPPVADAVPPVDPQQSRGVMRSLLSLSREINLGGDIGQFLRTFMLGGAQAIGENPVGAVGKGQLPNALLKGLRAMVSDGYAQRYRQEEAFRRFGGFFNPEAARVEEGGPSIAEGVLAGFQQRHRILGAPLWPFVAADRAVFDRFQPVFGSEAAKIIADGLPRRLTEGASPAQVDAWVGERLRNLIIGPSLSENATSIVGSAVNKVSDTIPFISPRRVRGEVRNVTQLGNFSTPEGHLARRFWAGATFSAVAVSVGMTSILTGKSPSELLDPRDEDSVVNPANWSRFLGVELPNGTVIKPFASYQPVARLFLQPAADALGKGYEATQAQQGFLAAAGVALDEYLKSSGTQVQKYGANRLSLPARLASEAMLFNKDYSGLPIRTADSALGQLEQVGIHGLRSQVPAFAQAFTQRERPMVPGTEPTTRQNLVDTALNWAFNISPQRPPNLPPDVEATLRAEVERRGGNPGNDPLRAFYDLRLPQNERERFEAQNPRVLDFFNQRTLVQEPTIAGPQGKKAITAYTWAQKAAAQDRTDRLRALEGQNLSGDEYRRQREKIMDDYAGSLRGAQLAIFKTTDRDEVAAILKKGYGKRTSSDQELDDTIEAFYAIRPANESRDAQDAFFVERDAFLDGLRPDLRKKFDETMEARAAQISQTELAYYHAQKIYQEYNRLPSYKGMTVDESRDASRLAGEARDYAQFSGKSASSYLLRRRDLTPAQKRNARKALSGAKYVNPARKRFMKDHSGSFARFYSSLNTDLVEQITTPDPRLAFLNG